METVAEFDNWTSDDLDRYTQQTQEALMTLNQQVRLKEHNLRMAQQALRAKVTRPV